MKFNVIVADCPWSFHDTLSMSNVPRGAIANYPTLNVEELKKLPIKSISDDKNGTVLALWVPSSLLQDGLDVMSAWGFHHKQTYVWVKTKKEPLNISIKQMKAHFKTVTEWSKSLKLDVVKNMISNFSANNIMAFGMGRLFRNSHELCLIGINNTAVYKNIKNKSQRTVSFGQNLKHSAKPDDLQNSLELMFQGCNMLELFARRDKQGWLSLGNQSLISNGEDIRDSIYKASQITSLQSIDADTWNKLPIKK